VGNSNLAAEVEYSRSMKSLSFRSNSTTSFFNNLHVSNIRVSNRTLIYNVCPKSALTWPSRHSRHRHLCRFYRSQN